MDTPSASSFSPSGGLLPQFNQFLLILIEQIENFSAGDTKIGRNVLLLQFIAQYPDCAMGDLSAALFLPPSSTTRKVKQLESRGWVVRHPAEDDNRRTVVSLTKSGSEIALTFARHQQESIRHVLAPLTPEERSQFDALLRKILQKMIS